MQLCIMTEIVSVYTSHILRLVTTTHSSFTGLFCYILLDGPLSQCRHRNCVVVIGTGLCVSVFGIGIVTGHMTSSVKLPPR